MTERPMEFMYRSDRLIKGRLLTRQFDPKSKDISAEWRPFLGSRVAVVLRREYDQFRCAGCGRVDELACYRKGLPPDFVVPQPRPDLHVTDEHLDIWSRKLAHRICSIAAEHLYLFDLPGDPDYVVPWPKMIFSPPQDSQIYDEFKQPDGVAFRPYLPPCEKCGRFRGMTFWAEFFEPPEDTVLAAAGIDTHDYPRMFRLLNWIVGPQLAEEIKAGSFSNVRLKDAFANLSKERRISPRRTRSRRP